MNIPSLANLTQNQKYESTDAALRFVLSQLKIGLDAERITQDEYRNYADYAEHIINRIFCPERFIHSNEVEDGPA